MDNRYRLSHILKAIDDIEKFLGNADLLEFESNEMMHNAILMQFIIIGESIVNVEAEILDKHNYPWYKVRSFRNLIAHEYFNIKMSAVWQITQKDLPELKNVINDIIQQLKTEN